MTKRHRAAQLKVLKKWSEPKPTKRELKILKVHGFKAAVLAMTNRLKVDHPAMAEVALAPFKKVHLPVPIDGVYLCTRRSEPYYARRRRKRGNGTERFRVVPAGDDLVVEVVIDGRNFEIIRTYLGRFEGVISHHVSAHGIKAVMHRELDGCDAGIVGSGKRQRFRRCTKANCLV